MSVPPDRNVKAAPEAVARVYEHRFTDRDAERKHAVWKEICRYLQRYVDPRSRVLDIACDRGYFIENITAADRWAADLRDVSDVLADSIHFVQADGLSLDRELPRGTFDLVFTSNYLEHLASGDEVVEQLRVIARLLKPGGTVMILQPNVRLVGAAYWDFIDHRVALTERSLTEAAELAGLETTKIVTRFLPYTTKSSLPQHPLAVRLYLALPPVRWVLGKQTLYLGECPR